MATFYVSWDGHYASTSGVASAGSEHSAPTFYLTWDGRYASTSGTAGGVSPSPPSSPTFLDLWFTSSLVPAALSVVRSGPVIYAQTGPGVVTAYSGNLPVFEDADGTGNNAGVWVNEAFTNTIASPFDFSVGWTTTGSIVYTANASNGPDGSPTADRLKDNSSSGIAAVFRAAAVSTAIFSLWVREVAGDATGSAGLLGQGNPTGSQVSGTSLGTGTGWRRIIHRVSGSAADFSIYPVGQQVPAVPFSSGTDNFVPTGSIDVWGAQIINSTTILRYPLTAGAASASLLQLTGSAELSKFVSTGSSVNFEASFIMAADSTGMLTSTGRAFVLLLTGSSGETSVRWVWNDGIYQNVFILRANSIDAVATAAGAATKVPSMMNWMEGDEVTVKAYAGPDGARLRVRVNGAMPAADDTNVNTTGSFTIGTPTVCYLGSSGSSGQTQFDALLTHVSTSLDASWTGSVEQATGVTIGDSTMGNNVNYPSIASCMMTPAMGRAGKRIAVVARAGDTISGQNTKWLASSYKGSNAVKWVAVMVGLNDVFNGTSVATSAAAYQTLVSNVRNNNPTTKIVLMLMLPTDSQAAMTPTKQQLWIDLNKCIAGTASGGGQAVSGSDLVLSGSMIQMNANGAAWASGPTGSNTQKGFMGIGDGTHPNNWARKSLLATELTGALVTLGVWP